MKVMLRGFVAVLLLVGCGDKPISKDECNRRGIVVFMYCECLRSSDPEVVLPAVDGLFEVGGLEAYMLLHLKWIAEPNTQIRNHILLGFSKIGDHRYIADPAFPRKWVEASRRFASPEKERRMYELKKYFPSDVKKLSG
ncbi:MAG: HEAT repeat domain-containing protein [Planctomycetota bacterium]|jgi:hypothetical protein